jgi:hypothetical protein
MEYKVIVVPISGVLTKDVRKSTVDFSREVNNQIALGWEPIGGVALSSHDGHLLQAMIKRR